MMKIRNGKPKGFTFKSFSKKQRKLLHWWRDGSPYKEYDMVLADGAIRSGKTIAMICSFLNWSMYSFSGQDFIIAGKSVGALKRNVIKPMKQILTAWGIKFYHNRSENYLIIGDNTYYLFGANNESSQDVLQGLTAAGTLADEVALFPRSFVDQMIARCSIEDSKVFMNCNPKGPFHFVKTEFIDKAVEKHIYHLHFDMDDNLTLSQKKKDSYFRQHKGVFFQRYILGLWVMAEGVIYDMFDKDKHVVPTVERDYSKYYISIDYGTQNPMAMGLWGLNNDIWYKVKEYHYSGREKEKQKSDTEYADDLEEFIGDLKITSIIVDPSASSFIAELKNRGLKVTKAKNDVENGIRNVSTALNEGLIKYNDVCKETFKEFHSYVWDEKAAERGIDKPIKQNDHQLDGDRYFCNTVLFKKKAKLGLLSEGL